MNEIRQHLMTGFESAFIDSTISSNLAYKPQFISNNHKEGRKVLSSIEEELLQCDEFCISVAFITVSGITPLLQTLKILENRGVKGRILTTNYLSFTEPKAITKLAEFSNIELKMFQSTSEGFHTKGYMFKQEDIYRIIVGSSNMTLSALTKNKEWNSKIVSTSQGEYMEDVLKEFNLLWNSQDTCEYDEFIEQYTIEYNLIKRQKQIARNAIVPSIEQYTLRPNMMQVAFIENLKKLQNEGEERALLLSATGDGVIIVTSLATPVNIRGLAA